MASYAIGARSKRKVKVLFDGQSYNNYPPPPLNFPTQLMSGMGVAWKNVGVDSKAWSELDDTAATRLFPELNADWNILIMSGGQQDIMQNDTEPMVTADAELYANTAKANGVDYVIITTIPFADDLFNVGGARDLVRVAHNNALIADANSVWNEVVEITWPADPPTGDGTHPNELGAKMYADILRTPVATAIAAAP